MGSGRDGIDVIQVVGLHVDRLSPGKVILNVYRKRVKEQERRK